MVKQTPNPELFVVYVNQEDKAEVSRRLEQLGSIEELDDNTILLRVKTKVSSPGSQWRELTDKLGSIANVQPVLTDEKGQTLYPTGDLTVRFPKKPTDKQLKDFAAKHSLKLRDRNEFVPEQAAFKLKEPASTYLPDVLEQVDADEDVMTAWPNTRSRYHRLS